MVDSLCYKRSQFSGSRGNSGYSGYSGIHGFITLPAENTAITMPLFAADEQIFDDELPLRENYQPERLQERDTELKQYQRALQPVINSSPPKNIFLYGKTGVGKTVATNYLLDHLQEDAEQYDVDLTIIKQPCNNITSSYQVAVNLVNQFRPSDNQISSTGYPQQDVFHILYDELNKVAAP